jgi:hypothetical protein
MYGELPEHSAVRSNAWLALLLTDVYCCEFIPYVGWVICSVSKCCGVSYNAAGLFHHTVTHTVSRLWLVLQVIYRVTEFLICIFPISRCCNDANSHFTEYSNILLHGTHADHVSTIQVFKGSLKIGVASC